MSAATVMPTEFSNDYSHSNEPTRIANRDHHASARHDPFGAHHGPSGTASLELIAAQFDLHPRALHRRLAAENTTFGALIDSVRRETAEH